MRVPLSWGLRTMTPMAIFTRTQKASPEQGNSHPAPAPFPVPQEIPTDFVRAGGDTLPPKSAVASGPTPIPDEALTAEEARRIKAPYWCWVEAQRILQAVDDANMYGTSEGADMIAAATAWATLSLSPVRPPEGAPHAG